MSTASVAPRPTTSRSTFCSHRRRQSRNTGVDLKPVDSMLDVYASRSQPKRAACDGRKGFEDICDESLDAQVAAATAVLDRVFAARATVPKPRS
jgi:hypothetical protein